MNFELQIEEPLKSMIDLPMTPLSCPLEYNTSLKFGKSPTATPRRDLEKVQEAHKNNTLEHEEDSCSEQEES